MLVGWLGENVCADAGIKTQEKNKFRENWKCNGKLKMKIKKNLIE